MEKDVNNTCFSKCRQIKEVTIGNDINIIGNSAFEGCSNLTNLMISKEDPPYITESAFYETNIENGILYVPASAMETYMYLTPWNLFKSVLSIEKFKLKYVVDGEVYCEDNYNAGSSIKQLSSEPSKEGYTFSGWGEIPETMPAHDVTVSGTFSINTYTLTYMIDEEVYKQTVYEYGASITPEPAPQDNYISFEWVGVPETMPAHDVTVTAVYETGIAEIMMMAQQGQVRIYAPNGKRLDKLQKGLRSAMPLCLQRTSW